MVRPKPTRKSLGAWYTPVDLVDVVVSNVLRDLADIVATGGWPRSRPVRVLDPACGDGRLLDAVRVRLHLDGHIVEATGCDIDASALARISHPAVRTIAADALGHEWGDERFDVVVGNPPFLSQMAAATTRGGSSRLGGGPYANSAAEFLALSVRLADPAGSAIGLVLPQSILASRDAAPVRDEVDRSALHTWSWWKADQRGLFDAAVNVCALGFRRPATGGDAFAWTRVVTTALGVPHLDVPALRTAGSIGDRADANANFRDEYYALVGAVDDDADGPPLVTSGLVDPGRSLWGTRPVKFAKRTYQHPRVDLSKLDGRFAEWARRKLVPKVLVANQTGIVEAVADPDGAWLPGVPVTTLTPPPGPEAVRTVYEIAAVLTSPIASAWCWHTGGGTGMSTTAVRLTPSVLSAVPWPAGDLAPAVAALRSGDVVGCGASVMAAFGVGAAPDRTAPGSMGPELMNWWSGALPHRA
jgi:SAM-dependent methyltransferase